MSNYQNYTTYKNQRVSAPEIIDVEYRIIKPDKTSTLLLLSM